MVPGCKKKHPMGKPKLKKPTDTENSLVCCFLNSSFKTKHQVANNEPILQGCILSIYISIYLYISISKKMGLLNSILGERKKN